MLHHLDLNVSDLARSEAVYASVLARIGWSRGESAPGWIIWRSGTTYITLVQTAGPHRDEGYHRKRVGLNHLAFAAHAREAVDEMHAWLRSRGISILYGGPMEMGTAAEPNYAVFFEDPDRVKIEFVFRPV